MTFSIFYELPLTSLPGSRLPSGPTGKTWEATNLHLTPCASWSDHGLSAFRDRHGLQKNTPVSVMGRFEGAFPQGLKPEMIFGGLMYGLKPVPFKLHHCTGFTAFNADLRSCTSQTKNQPLGGSGYGID